MAFATIPEALEEIRAGRIWQPSTTIDWSRLDAAHAAAYALSLAAVERLWQDSGDDGIRNLLRNPERLPQVTEDLDRKLGL